MIETSKWVFKKEVSIPDLIAIVMAITFPIASYYNIKTEIDILKIKQETIELQAKDSKEDTKALKQEIREDIREIKNNIQRLTEKR